MTIEVLIKNVLKNRVSSQIRFAMTWLIIIAQIWIKNYIILNEHIRTTYEYFYVNSFHIQYLFTFKQNKFKSSKPIEITWSSL